MLARSDHDDTAVLKEGRRRCWQVVTCLSSQSSKPSVQLCLAVAYVHDLLLQAKDRYFQCLASAQASQRLACAEERTAFENACPASWVSISLLLDANSGVGS